jgi:hypothetical protein
VRSADSVRNERTSRRRLAPSAAFTATSLCRRAARARRRFTTFALATRRRKDTAPSSTTSAGRTWPTSCSWSGTTVASIIQVFSPYVARRSLAMALTSACALSRGTSSRSLAMAFQLCAVRLGRTGSSSRGTQTSVSGRNEKPRHHSHDGVNAPRKSEIPRRKIRSRAQAALPETVAHEDRGRASLSKLLLDERPTDLRRDPKDLEELTGDVRGLDADGLVSAHDRGHSPGELRERVEALVPLMQIREIRVGESAALPFLEDLPDLHDAVGLGIRKGLQEHPVDDAEDRRRRRSHSKGATAAP